MNKEAETEVILYEVVLPQGIAIWIWKKLQVVEVEDKLDV